MIITYKFADGTSPEVEVAEEIGTLIINSRKAEHAQEEKQRYHCPFSTDGLTYEGMEYADPDTPESIFEQEQMKKRIYEVFSHLTEAQQRRLLMLADGLSLREIAKLEGIDIKTLRESIEQGRKKFQKFF